MPSPQYFAKSVIRRDPEVVFGPSDLLEAWSAKAKQPQTFKNIVVFGLAAAGGEAK